MNTASRMESTSKEARIHTSEYSARLAKEQDPRLMFSYRGKVSIKGKGDMKTYWLYNGEDADVEDTESSDYNALDGSNHRLLPPVEDIEVGSPEPTHSEDNEDVRTASVSTRSTSSGEEGEMDASSLPV